MKPLALRGRRFGRLVAESRHGTVVAPSGTQRATWVCRCDCGGSVIARSSDLTKGSVASCGCLKRDAWHETIYRHGHAMNTMTPEYQAWAAAKKRCGNPRDAGYHNYGGRGIWMCQAWVESFEVFWADMGPRPQGCSLDRIDANGNYEPGNCRWATRVQQANNTRASRRVVLDGESVTVAEASRIAGIDPSLVYGRLNNGWEIHEALGLRARCAAQ